VKFVPVLKRHETYIWLLIMRLQITILNVIKNYSGIDLFRCSIHAIKDVKRKLQSLQIPKGIKKEVKEIKQPNHIEYLLRCFHSFKDFLNIHSLSLEVFELKKFQKNSISNR